MKQHLITLFCLALIGCASPQQQEQNNETMNKENNELTAFDVQQEFQKKWLLLVYRESHPMLGRHH